MSLGLSQLTIIIVSVLQTVHASWWYLGIASSYQTLKDELEHTPEGNKCDSLPFLGPRQREMCALENKLIDIIHEGASMGIEECQYQFQNRRWNCTTFNTTNVFGKILNTKSRETAYIYAIFSAGVMYSVTRACSRGKLDRCGCDQNVRTVDTGGKFEWGGCSDNIRFGHRFSKEFVDSNEMRRSEKGLMNVWNNGAGRLNTKDKLDLICKCHGVSGSCSIRICWRRLKSFRTVGTYLKDKFDGASLVKMNKKRTKLRRIGKHQKRPTRKDLVYIEQSPDFCNEDPQHGSLGTHGRQCNQTSYGLDGCGLMCCGRGYYTLVTEVKDDCDCKFYWCCRVECKQCTQVVEKHFCN